MWVAIGISTYVIAILVASFASLRWFWNKIAREYPSVTPETDAISRPFQSCSIGIFNLGMSVRITVDSTHLHLTPNLFLLCATRTSMSIPWDDITPGKHFFFERYREFRVNKSKRKFTAPAWALDLANPTDSTNA